VAPPGLRGRRSGAGQAGSFLAGGDRPDIKSGIEPDISSSFKNPLKK